MYSVNCKVKRKENGKPASEPYLVEAVSLTDVDVKLAAELNGCEYSIVGCKEMKFNNIFTNGHGMFFQIKVTSEGMDGKTIKEQFIQEALDSVEATELFRESIKYGDITDMNLTGFLGVIK